LLEAGSMVIDVDQNTLTAKFLTSAGAIHDQFQIVKGSTCPPVPATGCNTAPHGKLTMRDGKWGWKWRGGVIEAADAGDPRAETDLAVCVYPATGPVLVGGQMLHGAPEWKAAKRGYLYRDKTFARQGFEKIKLRTGMPYPSTAIQVKGRATLPTLPASTPVTAQLVNLDTGACWSSTFATAELNQPGRFLAVMP
jgi:hypothetical protein